MSQTFATSNLSLRQLRAFMAVAQESSMTRAAAKLHLTPSALSMLVRAIEDDLGVRLFERTTRRLVLTDLGRQFLPTVVQVFAQLEAGVFNLHKSQDLKASRLRVAASPLLASVLLPKVIASFRTQYPQVRVSLLDMPVGAMADLVRRDEVDIAVCTANENTADLHVLPLYCDKLMVVCHVSHALAQKPEVPWQRLVDEPLILLRHGSGLRFLTDQHLAKWRKQMRPAYEVSQVATALGLVAEGEGVSVLPSYAITRAQGALQEAAIATVALISPSVERQIVAITALKLVAPHAGHAFVEHFKKHTFQK